MPAYLDLIFTFFWGVRNLLMLAKWDIYEGLIKRFAPWVYDKTSQWIGGFYKYDYKEANNLFSKNIEIQEINILLNYYNSNENNKTKLPLFTYELLDTDYRDAFKSKLPELRSYLFKEHGINLTNSKFQEYINHFLKIRELNNNIGRQISVYNKAIDKFNNNETFTHNKLKLITAETIISFDFKTLNEKLKLNLTEHTIDKFKLYFEHQNALIKYELAQKATASKKINAINIALKGYENGKYQVGSNYNFVLRWNLGRINIYLKENNPGLILTKTDLANYKKYELAKYESSTPDASKDITNSNLAQDLKKIDESNFVITTGNFAEQRNIKIAEKNKANEYDWTKAPWYKKAWDKGGDLVDFLISRTPGRIISVISGIIMITLAASTGGLALAWAIIPLAVMVLTLVLQIAYEHYTIFHKKAITKEIRVQDDYIEELDTLNKTIEGLQKTNPKLALALTEEYKDLLGQNSFNKIKRIAEDLKKEVLKLKNGDKEQNNELLKIRKQYGTNVYDDAVEELQTLVVKLEGAEAHLIQEKLNEISKTNDEKLDAQRSILASIFAQNVLYAPEDIGWAITNLFTTSGKFVLFNDKFSQLNPGIITGNLAHAADALSSGSNIMVFLVIAGIYPDFISMGLKENTKEAKAFQTIQDLVFKNKKTLLPDYAGVSPGDKTPPKNGKKPSLSLKEKLFELRKANLVVEELLKNPAQTGKGTKTEYETPLPEASEKIDFSEETAIDFSEETALIKVKADVVNQTYNESEAAKKEPFKRPTAKSFGYNVKKFFHNAWTATVDVLLDQGFWERVVRLFTKKPLDPDFDYDVQNPKPGSYKPLKYRPGLGGQENLGKIEKLVKDKHQEVRAEFKKEKEKRYKAVFKANLGTEVEYPKATELGAEAGKNEHDVKK